MNKKILTWVLVAVAVLLVLYVLYERNADGSSGKTGGSLFGLSSKSGGSSSGSSSGSGGDDSGYQEENLSPASPECYQKDWIYRNLSQQLVANVAAKAGWYEQNSKKYNEIDTAFWAACYDLGVTGNTPLVVDLGEHVGYQAFINHIKEYYNRKGQNQEKYKNLLNGDGYYYVYRQIR